MSKRDEGSPTVPPRMHSLLLACTAWMVFLGAVHAQGESGVTGTVEREVRFSNGAVTLAGTLAIPGGPGPHPALVFVSGSGPQNRDCTLSGFPLFRTLSDILVVHGIAVLRFDDRGVGASTGVLAQSTLYDFAADVEAGIAMLRKEASIAPDRVGVLGHSEGGAVAQIVASRTPVACVVMLAGPGAGIAANVLLQKELIDRAEGMSESRIGREISLLRDIFPVLLSGKDVSSLLPGYRIKAEADRKEMDAQTRRALSDLDWYARTLFSQHMKMMNTPWFRSAIAYEPGEILGAVSCPLLALYGGKDLQVPAEINAGALRIHAAACLDSSISVRILPDANHLFQAAKTGSLQEYESLEKNFCAGLSTELVGWLKKTLW
jgi:uncharacterized protein